jgi:hypothetical protein
MPLYILQFRSLGLISQLDPEAGLGCHAFHITVISGLRSSAADIDRALKAVAAQVHAFTLIAPCLGGGGKKLEFGSPPEHKTAVDAAAVHVKGKAFRPPVHITIGSVPQNASPALWREMNSRLGELPALCIIGVEFEDDCQGEIIPRMTKDLLGATVPVSLLSTKLSFLAKNRDWNSLESCLKDLPVDQQRMMLSNAIDDKQYSVLMHAVWWGDQRVVRSLLRKYGLPCDCSRVNYRGEDVLGLATRRIGETEAADRLGVLKSAEELVLARIELPGTRVEFQSKAFPAAGLISAVSQNFELGRDGSFTYISPVRSTVTAAKIAFERTVSDVNCLLATLTGPEAIYWLDSINPYTSYRCSSALPQITGREKYSVIPSDNRVGYHISLAAGTAFDTGTVFGLGFVSLLAYPISERKRGKLSRDGRFRPYVYLVVEVSPSLSDLSGNSLCSLDGEPWLHMAIGLVGVSVASEGGVIQSVNPPLPLSNAVKSSSSGGVARESAHTSQPVLPHSTKTDVKMSPSVNNNSIIVEGLDASINVTVLTRHFSCAGSVAKVDVLRDPVTTRPTGTAIVTFKVSTTTDVAVMNLNGSIILGRPCRVSHIPKEAHPVEELVAKPVEPEMPALPDGAKPDDWMCPNVDCVFHNFAKNTHCRNCSIRKPSS